MLIDSLQQVFLYLFIMVSGASEIWIFSNLAYDHFADTSVVLV